MIYPENFENKIGFNIIKTHIKNLCISSLGKSKTENIYFSEKLDYIIKELTKTSEFKQIILNEENFPVSYYINVTEILDRLKNKASYISESEAFDLFRSLNTIVKIIQFFKKDTEYKYPELKELCKQVSSSDDVIKEISKTIDNKGKIRNNASKLLSEIRQSLNVKKSNISSATHRILNKAKSDGTVSADIEISVRDGRLVIPLPASHKRKINGYIVDESSTGQTVYVEPAEVVKLNNEIKELEFAEKREIIRILTELTNFIRPHIQELLNSYDFLAEIDFIRAKAGFSFEIKAVQPTVKDKAFVQFLSARHPLLYLAYKKSEKEVIPSDIKIDEENKIILVSGPNAGGKSVILKTGGLLQYMLQCGIHIPVKEQSETGIFSNIFIDIGDEQSIENDLSTYSSHLTNMNYFIRNANEDTLFLIDEFGTGTEPLIGGAMAQAVLQELMNKNSKGIITTHYTNLKQYAETHKGITNAAMLFDQNKLQPLYKLETGNAGSSFALEIAHKTGLPKNVIEEAKNNINSDYLNFEEILKRNQREKRKLNQEKRKLRSQNNLLQENIEKYESEIEQLLTKKKEIIEQSKREADQILSSVNKQIENTIYEIKKQKADKEKTKELRKNLEKFKEETSEKQTDDIEKIKQKIEKLKNKSKKKRKVKTEKETVEKSTVFHVGDYVKMKGYTTAGEIQKIQENKITVAFGSIFTTVDKKELTKISEYQKDAIKKTKNKVNIIRQKKSDIHSSAGPDVRGMRAEEALKKIMEFIDDAVVEGKHNFRILHGTGAGILKTVIRQYLSKHEKVMSYSDAPVEQGGAGITIVTLS